MNENLVACIQQSLAARSNEELMQMWRTGYSKRDHGEAREALRRLCLDRGLKVSSVSHAANITFGDLLLCVLLPVIALVIGIAAILRGQVRRGFLIVLLGLFFFAVEFGGVAHWRGWI